MSSKGTLMCFTTANAREWGEVGGGADTMNGVFAARRFTAFVQTLRSWEVQVPNESAVPSATWDPGEGESTSCD